MTRTKVDVVVPGHQILLGPEYDRDIALPFTVGVPPEDLDMVFSATTRQIGAGTYMAVALDLTQ